MVLGRLFTRDVESESPESEILSDFCHVMVLGRLFTRGVESESPESEILARSQELELPSERQTPTLGIVNMLIFKSLHGTAPLYLSDELLPAGFWCHGVADYGHLANSHLSCYWPKHDWVTGHSLLPMLPVPHLWNILPASLRILSVFWRQVCLPVVEATVLGDSF